MKPTITKFINYGLERTKSFPVTEISPEDILDQFKIAAAKEVKSYFLINLTDAVTTDPQNPAPGFIVEVKPVKSAQKVVVSYFRVPQAYVLPESIETTVRQAVEGLGKVEFIDKGKEQKHKDCPDPTQYKTRNYGYNDAIDALNPRIEKKSFFAMANKAAPASEAPAVPPEIVPPAPGQSRS